MRRFVAWLTIRCLKSTRFSIQQKTYITSALLDNLQAVHIRDVVKYDPQGQILINGVELEVEQIQNFLQSIRVLKDNTARKILRDQVAFEATKMGVHQGLTPEMIIFSKAVLWIQQQEERLLAELLVE